MSLYEEIRHLDFDLKRIPEWNPHKHHEVPSRDFLRHERQLWAERVHPYEVPGYVQTTLRSSSTLANAALNAFVERISTMSWIDSVQVVTLDQGKYDIWTVMKDFDEETEEKVAEVELQLVRDFPELIFDFMIVPRLGRDISEIAPPESRTIYTSR